MAGKMATRGGINVTSKIKGAKTSRANIRKMDKATRKKFFDALVEIAEDILTRSQTKYVPVLSGDLLRSGTVISHPGRYPSVEVGFGGAAVDYAVLQHENTQFQHPRGGKAKYLELAVDDFRPQIPRRLAQAVSAEMRLYDLRGKYPV